VKRIIKIKSGNTVYIVRTSYIRNEFLKIFTRLASDKRTVKDIIKANKNFELIKVMTYDEFNKSKYSANSKTH